MISSTDIHKNGLCLINGHKDATTKTLMIVGVILHTLLAIPILLIMNITISGIPHYSQAPLHYMYASYTFVHN